jgi:hypothetical protein
VDHRQAGSSKGCQSFRCSGHATRTGGPGSSGGGAGADRVAVDQVTGEILAGCVVKVLLMPLLLTCFLVSGVTPCNACSSALGTCQDHGITTELWLTALIALSSAQHLLLPRMWRQDTGLMLTACYGPSMCALLNSRVQPALCLTHLSSQCHAGEGTKPGQGEAQQDLPPAQA